MDGISKYAKFKRLLENRFLLVEVMSRNRFELILGMFHCGNNETIEHGRLNKV